MKEQKRSEIEQIIEIAQINKDRVTPYVIEFFELCRWYKPEKVLGFMYAHYTNVRNRREYDEFIEFHKNLEHLEYQERGKWI